MPVDVRERQAAKSNLKYVEENDGDQNGGLLSRLDWNGDGAVRNAWPFGHSRDCCFEAG
jgi:hypothetical protein